MPPHQSIAANQPTDLEEMKIETTKPDRRIFLWMGLVLLLLVLAGVALGYFYRQQRAAQAEIVILVTDLSGPAPKDHRVAKELAARLQKELAGYQDTLVLSVKEAVTEQQGSGYARTLGEERSADIVLWGWYTLENGNVRLTLNVEQLTKGKYYDSSPGRMILSDEEASFDFFTLQQDFNDQLNALALFLRGVARLQAGDIPLGLESIAQAIDHPEWGADRKSKATALIYRGTFYLIQYETVQAIADYSQAIELDRLNARAYVKRCVVYGSLGDHDKQFADCTRATQIDPKNAFAYYLRGNGYLHIGMYQDAIVDYTQAIQLDPTDAAAYIQRGIAHNGLDENDHAIADFSAAIQLDPQNPQVYAYRARVYILTGQDDKTIADLTQIIQLDSENLDAYFNRGLAYTRKGEPDKAIADYGEVIEHYQTYAPAYLNRGLEYTRQGESAKAIADYDQAIQLDPENSPAYFNRAIAYESLGEDEKAIADYTEAIWLDTSNVDAFLKRADLYLKLGMKEQAIKDLKQAQQRTKDKDLQAVLREKLETLSQ